MKICFFANINSIHSQRWIQYFLDRHYDVSLISNSPTTDFNINAAYFIKDGKNKLFGIIKNVFNVRRILKRIKPDIIHAHYAGVSGALAALSGFHPFVLTVWGSDILLTSRSIFGKFLVKFIMSRADIITCDAEHLRKKMIELGVDSAKIKLVYFGVDMEKFQRREKDSDLIRQRGLSECRVVISLRSLKPIYNIETLILATPKVLKVLPNTKIIILGDGPGRKKLEDLADSTGVKKDIIFIGNVDNNILPRYLSIADVYVSTALSDAGLSSSTAEAMACELPVIVTDVADNKDWVKDGENGFIFPMKDHELLSKKIIFLLNDEKVMKSLGRNGRELIENKNNYYKEMEKMQDIYNNVIG